MNLDGILVYNPEQVGSIFHHLGEPRMPAAAGNRDAPLLRGERLSESVAVPGGGAREGALRFGSKVAVPP